MVLDVVRIENTGKGEKSVADDLEAVLRKIENWHQGSIACYRIGFRDDQALEHSIEWYGKKAIVCRG